jgi:glucosamine-6-phosphate deaminase
MQNFKNDKLSVKIYETRAEMGAAAGKEISDCIKTLLTKKSELNMIFAAAPSQNEVLAYLTNDKTIPWEKINAFHMDEYVGIDPVAPQGFARFLKNALFDNVPFKSVNTLNSLNDPDAETERYSKLLKENPVDIVCMGIGENGHIAFNDPHVADFNDSAFVKIVDLDDVCRMQQVHDGCFATLDDVPKYALTLTVPALAAGKYQFCVVPAPTKANAVKNTVKGEINEKCPATILRTLENATLYCDNDSGALIKE